MLAMILQKKYFILAFVCTIMTNYHCEIVLFLAIVDPK